MRASAWRLTLSSDLDIQVLAYIRHDDGFLTSMHDAAPRAEDGRRVAIFNPGSNPDQVSGLRLVNPTAEDAEVTVAGIDDAGASPGTAVVLPVPAGDSRTFSAETLEGGGEGPRRARRRQGQMAPHGDIGTAHRRDEPDDERHGAVDQPVHRARPRRNLTRPRAEAPDTGHSHGGYGRRPATPSSAWGR